MSQLDKSGRLRGWMDIERRPGIQRWRGRQPSADSFSTG